MSWLKTVAQDLLKGITYASAIAQGIDPLVNQSTTAGKVLNTVTSDLGTIGNLTTVAETMATSIGNATGAQKLAAVLPFVSTLIQQSELVIGKTVADEAGFEDRMFDGHSGIVKIQNSLKKQGTQATPVQLPAPAVAPTTTKIVK